jgi:hypothetical protein
MNHEFMGHWKMTEFMKSWLLMTVMTSWRHKHEVMATMNHDPAMSSFHKPAMHERVAGVEMQNFDQSNDQDKTYFRRTNI